jgi:DNA-binding NarL/FixJ family response regulator
LRHLGGVHQTTWEDTIVVLAEACQGYSKMAVNNMLQDHIRDSKKGKRARVLLADDHPAVAKELCALLQPEFDVIATVGDGNALLAAAEALSPDVIVTDIAMPGLDGIAAASEILSRNPAARIVFVTVHDDVEMVKKGLAIGVLGYVLKLTAGEDLVPAINAALRGVHHLPAWYSGK